VYFTLKDSIDGSTLACLIFRYAYQVSGVALTIGDEVIVEGAPEIYKPSGRLSFKVGSIEVAGEGALKKAYDELFFKLENEGLFVLDQKKLLPEYVERIALITSADGAAIDDFKKNLGDCGFKVTFYPASVEGKKAVFEILKAIEYFRIRAMEFDVLVIIRGGGSLESLQAFNNETLVREVGAFPIPTLLGVGHEKDITLSALASDVMVSTPTATAQAIAASWLEARQRVSYLRKNLLHVLEQQLRTWEQILEKGTVQLAQFLRDISRTVETCEQRFTHETHRFGELLKQEKKALLEAKTYIHEGFSYVKKRYEQQMIQAEEALRVYDPLRALRLGYSLIHKGAQLVKDTASISRGDILTIQLAKGSLETEVKKII
jgi:exodeoxyribonuclease VII large subunit